MEEDKIPLTSPEESGSLEPRRNWFSYANDGHSEKRKDHKMDANSYNLNISDVTSDTDNVKEPEEYLTNACTISERQKDFSFFSSNSKANLLEEDKTEAKEVFCIENLAIAQNFQGEHSVARNNTPIPDEHIADNKESNSQRILLHSKKCVTSLSQKEITESENYFLNTNVVDSNNGSVSEVATETSHTAEGESRTETDRLERTKFVNLNRCTAEVSDDLPPELKSERITDKTGLNKNSSNNNTEDSFSELETETAKSFDLPAKKGKSFELKETTFGEDVLKSQQAEYEELVYNKPVVKQSVAEEAAITSKTNQFSYEKILGIFIHKTDSLPVDDIVRGPLVKVHILNLETGNYLKKSDKERNVSFYYENGVECIQPLMTKPYDFKLKKVLVPCWEELLIFNEDINYIIEEDNRVLIIFELLAMISLSTAAMRYEKLGSECGWHKISWAFLRPVGAGGFLNTDKQVRLQLYKPCKTKGTVNDSCEAFTWWKRRLLKYYPSTLYVTVKGIIPPEKLTPTLRSHLALQPEFSSSNNHLTINFHDHVQTSTGNQGIKEKIQWSRLPVQSCKVPNRCALSLGPTPPGGCMSLSFSHLGTYLACGMLCSLTIYSIPNGSQYMSLSGHQGFIYDLSWSVNDKFLLSVSADNSAYVWNVGQGVKNPFQVLTHPSFVYCGKFHISRSTIFVTGSYDQILRVFSRASKTSEYQLIQELEAHKGFITSVCFKDSTTIVSADSVGGIVIWSRVKVRKHFHHWEYERKLDIREIHDVIVNCICVHPAGRRLLVHTRDSLLRMIDLRTGSAIQWFRGAINNRYHSKASISPCGNLVFCGSEDGAVHVWHSDTGDKVATYTNLKFSSTENSVVSMVTYHPLDHMIAFASYDSYSNILVCDFKKNASCSNLGLKLSIQAHKCINISGLDNENDSDIFNKSLTTLMSLKSLHRVSHSLQGTGILNRDFHESNSNLESPAVSGTIKQNVVNSAYKEDGGKHFVEPFQQ